MKVSTVSIAFLIIHLLVSEVGGSSADSKTAEELLAEERKRLEKIEKKAIKAQEKIEKKEEQLQKVQEKLLELVEVQQIETKSLMLSTEEDKLEEELEKLAKKHEKKLEEIKKQLETAETELLAVKAKEGGKAAGLEDYKAWKKEFDMANSIHADLSEKLNWKFRPVVKWYNIFADEDVCSEGELRATDKKLAALFNSILDTRGFDPIIWYETAARSYFDEDHQVNEENRRKLRGTIQSRKLYYHRYSFESMCYYSSYLCRVLYPSRYGWRRNMKAFPDLATDDRALSGNEDEIPAIDPQSPEELEEVIADLKTQMERQCESLLALIGKTSPRFDDDCGKALSKVKCEAYFNLADLILPE